MNDFKAIILDRSSKKAWYIRYTVFYDNGESVTAEESTKVLKNEKSIAFMRSKYLPVWIARKKEELKIRKKEVKEFDYFAHLFLSDQSNMHDYDNLKYRVNRALHTFGRKDVSKISKLDIKQWLNGLENNNKRTKQDLSKNSKLKYLRVLRGIFEIALDAEVVKTNICDDIRFNEESKRDLEKIEPFSVEETLMLLEASKNRQYGEHLHEYLGIAFNQGMSPSEILGLQAGDIDLTRQMLIIRRGITKGKVKETKTVYRDRTLPILNTTMPYIETLLREARQKRTIWLFSDASGSYLKDIEAVRGDREIIVGNKKIKNNTRWYKLLSDCKIAYRDLKNTRHTFAVRALETKALTFQELANFLGHGSLQMIINHYAKWVGNKAINADKNIDLFGDLLGDRKMNKGG